MSEDASATYRGFRNQALYVLYRLLTDTNSGEQVYRPEGAEDLAVFDSQMRLTEVVQVKDYSTELAQSHFKPKSNQGFFARVNRRKKEYPECKTKLATFGPLGPEFDGAIIGEAKHRSKFVAKLCSANTNISSTDAIAVLDGLKGNILHPVVSELHTSVRNALQGTNIGGELERSIELLMFWVFDASEKQRDLTKQGLLLQLERIGSYLAALRDASSEWGVSITPIKQITLTPDECTRWTAEYRRGVQARWEHVVSGADCARTDRLHEVHKQLQNRSVVIIRGASGQGKSTIGWRYIHDYCAEGLRFHVRLVEGREHAHRIANALGGHVRKLNLKAVAYLDVSPSDAGWSDLVRELVAAGLKVLVAVREEDFRRANIAVGDFDYSEVVLERVTKEEAEAIFFALRPDRSANVLDFGETWARFATEQGGPLLEFTHLVSEGESLESRIASQICRIQNDAAANANGFTKSHLELLALAAVANETGARVDLSDLFRTVGLDPLTRPLKALENEFLLRAEDDGGISSVAGLHALRSRAVVKALFADAPALWEKYAVQVLPLIIDEDIENFLLSAFSRRPDFSDAICERLHKIAPKSWTHAGGIVRSLIWEGLSRYERRNRTTILEAISKYHSAWCFVCDSFVGLDDDAHRQLLATMNDGLEGNVQTISLTPKAEIFELFAAWAGDPLPPTAPQHPRDWSSVGDIAHWLGHTKTSGTLRAAIEKILPSPLPTDLRIEELGLFISGRAQLNDDGFSLWHDSERSNIIKAFLRETDSAHVADDGIEVKVFFSVPVADSINGGIAENLDWHGQTMKRIRLLRLLFPQRDTFGAQGLGLEIFMEHMTHDPTFKKIPAKSLPLERGPRLNAIFASLVAYRHNRPGTWKNYASAVLSFREAVSACFRKLHRGWAKLLSEAAPRPNTVKELPGAELDRIKTLSKLPLFPKTAVDEWGFLSEEKQDKQSAIETMQERSLRRFGTWRKSFREFESCVGQVTARIINVTVLYLAEHKGHVANDEDERTLHLLSVNLALAWEELREMQREFRARFGGLFENQRLDELDAYEQSNFRHLWSVCFAMRYERKRHLSNVCQMAEADIGRRKAQFLQALRTEINLALGEFGTVIVQEKPWYIDGTPHLCIACDYHKVEDIGIKAPIVVQAMWRAAQSGGWRALEWKPLEIEWPKIALVNLVCGKALLPACATILTASLFVTSEDFQVHPYHHTALPVSSDTFAGGGFSVWESPLLRAAVALQGNVLAFVLTHARFYQLAKLILEQKLEQIDTDRILDRFSDELKIVLAEAQRTYRDAIQILNTSTSQDKTEWLEALERFCSLLLIEVNEDVAITITLETFTTWAAEFEDASTELQKLILEIATFALEGSMQGNSPLPS